MKKQCNRCKWHLPFIDKVKNDGTGDTHVCGETLIPYVDEIGIKRFKMHGGIQHCDECGQPLQDNRRIVYEKCAHRNKNYKCSAFSPKIIWAPALLFQKVLGLFQRKSK